MKKLRRSIILASSILVIPAMIACNGPSGKSAEEAAQPAKEQTVQRVKTIPVTSQVIKRAVEVTASIQAEEETYLAPAISGKIRSIKVDVNDRVGEGEVLVKMDRTQLAQTQVQYENLKKDLARMDTLIRYGSVTQQSYDQMKTQVSVTGVMLENLEENTVLRAPYNGVITGKYYNDGELFSPSPNTPAGKPAILSLVKMDVLKLLINLSESYLPLVKKGQSAVVTTDVYPREPFTAEVYRIYPTINAASRTFTVELRMDNPGYRLRPGMFSTVNLELGDREAMLVPAIAVQKQPGTNNRYIFVHENGTAKRVNVQVGERVDDHLELLTNGVREGDALIYAGHVNLMDGDPVEVVKD